MAIWLCGVRLVSARPLLSGTRFGDAGSRRRARIGSLAQESGSEKPGLEARVPFCPA